MSGLLAHYGTYTRLVVIRCGLVIYTEFRRGRVAAVWEGKGGVVVEALKNKFWSLSSRGFSAFPLLSDAQLEQS